MFTVKEKATMFVGLVGSLVAGGAITESEYVATQEFAKRIIEDATKAYEAEHRQEGLDKHDRMMSFTCHD